MAGRSLRAGPTSLTAPGRDAKAPAVSTPGRAPSQRLLPGAGLPPPLVPSLLRGPISGINVIRDNGIMALSQTGGLTCQLDFSNEAWECVTPELRLAACSPAPSPTSSPTQASHNPKNPISD